MLFIAGMELELFYIFKIQNIFLAVYTFYSLMTNRFVLKRLLKESTVGIIK